jgi:hypothetical protein
VKRAKQILALLLVTLGNAAIADDWPAARAFVVFSESAAYFVRFVPGESIGDTYGFAGAAKGRYATGLLYGLQPDRTYKLIREITLVNPVAPLAALVSDAGHFITFDNWHNVGYGKVVAIYDPSGKMIRSYELTDLYPKEKLEMIPRSISSRYWRCAPTHFVEPKEQESVVVSEKLGGYFVFELATGKFKYTAGSRQECPTPNQPMSWSSVGR